MRLSPRPVFRATNMILLSISALLIVSCNDFNRLSERAKLILKNDDSQFRGLDFDVSIEAVKEHETATLIEAYEDYLRYQDSSKTHPGEYIEVEYFFNHEDQLDLLIAFYPLEQDEAIDNLVQELKSFLDNRYGRAIQDELGWYNWEYEDDSGISGTIEINLVGEKEEGYRGVELEMLKYYEFEEQS